jgi:hypothetical protein
MKLKYTIMSKEKSESYTHFKLHRQVHIFWKLYGPSRFLSTSGTLEGILRTIEEDVKELEPYRLVQVIYKEVK